MLKQWPPQYDCSYIPSSGSKFWFKDIETMDPEEKRSLLIPHADRVAILDIRLFGHKGSKQMKRRIGPMIIDNNEVVVSSRFLREARVMAE